MRNILVAVAAVAMSAGLVMAQGAPTPAAQPETKKAASAKPAKKAAAPKTESLSGTVEAMDAATNKLSVKDAKGAVKEFVLAPTTKITKGGKAITLAELTAGEKVQVKFVGTDVKSVNVHAPKAAPAKGGKKGAKKEEKKAETPAAPPAAGK
jgi:hypothetical protein